MTLHSYLSILGLPDEDYPEMGAKFDMYVLLLSLDFSSL
jgi:hypothetical protein